MKPFVGGPRAGTQCTAIAASALRLRLRLPFLRLRFSCVCVSNRRCAAWPAWTHGSCDFPALRTGGRLRCEQIAAICVWKLRLDCVCAGCLAQNPRLRNLRLESLRSAFAGGGALRHSYRWQTGKTAVLLFGSCLLNGFQWVLPYSTNRFKYCVVCKRLPP